MATLIPKYDQGATGAVNRPINEKLAEILSVQDFIPSGIDISTTDCTAYINAAILAAQKLKAEQLPTDPRYDVTVKFDEGQKYYVEGTILIPSGITLDGNGCLLVGNYPSAISGIYSDAEVSTIETATYTEAGGIVSNRNAAGSAVDRCIQATIKNFTFEYMNCAINAINFQEGSSVQNCDFRFVTAAVRLKSSYYSRIDGSVIRYSTQGANQQCFHYYGDNTNNISVSNVHISDAICGIKFSSTPNLVIDINNFSFEGAYVANGAGTVNGVGIYFIAGTYSTNVSIQSCYFEQVYKCIVNIGDIYGAVFTSNSFIKTQYAIDSQYGTTRMGEWRANSHSDQGGVIRNLVNFALYGNDVTIESENKSTNTTTGFISPPSNVIIGPTSISSSVYSWVDNTDTELLGKSEMALGNNNKLGTFNFTGGCVVAIENEIPFTTKSQSVNRLVLYTKIPDSPANILVFHLYGTTNSGPPTNFTLSGFIFGTSVYWINHDPVGVTFAILNDVNGYALLEFTNLPTSGTVGVVNVSGQVRHV
jgi:hypothetical protein